MQGQVGFAAGQVDFQVTCLLGQVAVETIVVSCFSMFML